MIIIMIIIIKCVTEFDKTTTLSCQILFGLFFLGRLYAAARRAGYNVLALGQHLGKDILRVIMNIGR